MTTRGLSDEQVRFLLTPLHQGRVRQVQGQSHLEAWDIRRHLLRVFGWGGWDVTVLKEECIFAEGVEKERRNKPGETYRAWTVVYKVVMRLTIKGQDGEVLAVFEDGATGDASNQPSVGDAHDMALKTAMSQALKRCAANLGDQFGLSLYNGGRADAVVHRSLAHVLPDAPKQEAAALPADDVHGGELDEVPANVDKETGEVRQPSPVATTAADLEVPCRSCKTKHHPSQLHPGLGLCRPCYDARPAAASPAAGEAPAAAQEAPAAAPAAAAGTRRKATAAEAAAGIGKGAEQAKAG